MAIVKLATGPVTMTVASAVQTEGNFGPQVCFTSDVGDMLYISEKSATGQLTRLNLTLESCIGKTLHFEQIKKDGKTFTNISTAAAGQASPAAAPAPRPAAMDIASIATLYGQCVDMAMSTLAAKCEAAGVPYDAAALQSEAATMFIRASK